MSNGDQPGNDAYDRQIDAAKVDEAAFLKAIEDEWHACRVTLLRDDAGPELLGRRLLHAQQVILASIYYLRTGRPLR